MFKMMFTMSIMSMLWWRKNIIPMLISMEMMLLSMFMVLNQNIQNISSIYMMMLMVMMVSGSSMGLSMLVSMSRSQKSTNSMMMKKLT